MAHSVEKQLLAEPVRRLDLGEYILVTTDTSVRDTVERMSDMERACAFVVGEGTRLVGIVTDRDILKKVVSHPEMWDKTITEIMTPNPKTLPPNATTAEALRMMEEGRFRNVPIVQENGHIIGNLTHFSILNYLSDQFGDTVYNLPPDPDNYADTPYGG